MTHLMDIFETGCFLFMLLWHCVI